MPNKKLYRFNDQALQEAAHELLERETLTDEMIHDFCWEGKGCVDVNNDNDTATSFKKAYRARRQEIHELTKLLPSGGARIDRYGRLRRVSERETSVPPAAPPLPPLPVARAVLAGPNLNNHDVNGLLLREQQEAEAEERQAAAAIARALARYRERAGGLDEVDLQLVRVRPAVAAAVAVLPPLRQQLQQQRQQGPPVVAAGPRPRNNNINNNANLTLRRTSIAVFTVVAAFLCMLLQTLPLWQTTKQRSVAQDELQDAVLHVKHLLPHALECGGTALHRSPPNSNLDPSSWLIDMSSLSSSNNKKKRIHFYFYSTGWNTACRLVLRTRTTFLSATRWMHRTMDATQPPPVDCSDGVLHLPSPAVMFDNVLMRFQNNDLWNNFTTQGINTTWFLPCHPPSGTQVFADAASRSAQANTTEGLECRVGLERCFRGVHDNLVSERHVQQALRLGAHLIAQQGDHFDIHYDVIILKQRLPSVVSTLRKLLRERYHVTDELLQPVAFRVNAVGPMNGEGVPLYGRHVSSNSLVRVLNRTRYIEWMEAAERRNEMAQFPLPWPFRRLGFQPVRDTCNLLADLEADPSFAIHTTVFLSEGAGKEYSGGVGLYVDYDDEMYRTRHQKIRRGISMDGARGRVVVSTGGLENRRCRLPTRAGVRATLQIWWSTQGPSS